MTSDKYRVIGLSLQRLFSFFTPVGGWPDPARTPIGSSPGKKGGRMGANERIFRKDSPLLGIFEGNLSERMVGRGKANAPLVSPRIWMVNSGKKEGQIGGGKVSSAGVELEPESLEHGTVFFLVGPGGDLVSPDVIDHEVDRAALVEHRGKERGGRELLGQGKGKPLFFSPSFLRTVVMKRWARKT